MSAPAYLALPETEAKSFGRHAAALSRQADGGEIHRFYFGNGLGASVARTETTIGGPDGFWEIAVVDHDDYPSSTPVFDTEVLGFLTEDTVALVLDKIEALP